MKKYNDIITKYSKIITYNKNSYYGLHISILPDIFTSFDNILNLKCNSLQIFLSNPRTGKMAKNSINWYMQDNNHKKIKEIINKFNLKLFIHSPYVFNFAKSIIDHNWNKCYWINNILIELKIAHFIGAIGCIIHVGKQLNLDKNTALNNMYESISYIIEEMSRNQLKSKLILETSAGQGTELLSTNGNIDSLSEFYNRFSRVQKKYIKLCIDTCHIFSAGYDIRKKNQVKDFFDEIKEKIGIKYIYIIHLNDSKEDFNSKKDRHENLGKGYIGLEGLSYIIKYAKTYKIPLILETPDKTNKNIKYELNYIRSI